MTANDTVLIDEPSIFATLERAGAADAAAVRAVLAKGRELHGLDAPDVAVLMTVSDPELLGELFRAAQDVKDTIYGRRLVLFAPLYVSNMCANECTYCAFRARNKSVVRRALSQEEVAQEVRILIDQGHKRVLLVAGESYPREGFSYVLKCVDTIYGVAHAPGRCAAST
jgi:2-iminoacetate synthase